MRLVQLVIACAAWAALVFWIETQDARDFRQTFRLLVPRP